MKRIGLLLLAALIAAAPALALEEYPPEDWADVLRAQALPLQTRLETGARGEDVRLLQQSLIFPGMDLRPKKASPLTRRSGGIR